MKRRDDKDYHSERARAEIDLAYRADTQVAAEAHLRLSALHLARLRMDATESKAPTIN
jgi:hypothetical protein